jgi:hypothetical protein
METRPKSYSLALSLLLGSIIIGASFIYSSKHKDEYDFSTSPLGVYRLDKSTGKIDYCQTKLIDNMEFWVVDCSGKYAP